jgi:hypothetical protein
MHNGFNEQTHRSNTMARTFTANVAAIEAYQDKKAGRTPKVEKSSAAKVRHILIGFITIVTFVGGFVHHFAHAV